MAWRLSVLGRCRLRDDCRIDRIRGGRRFHDDGSVATCWHGLGVHCCALQGIIQSYWAMVTKEGLKGLNIYRVAKEMKFT